MIPLFAPGRQNEPFTQSFQDKLGHLIGTGTYILGPEVESFEKNLAIELDYKFAEGCSSGTDALILALKALELPQQSEILTPAFSFVASATSILWAGHRPVFIDIDPETGCLDFKDLQRSLTPKTRAVIAVDIFGRQAIDETLVSFCRKHNLPLIEDGAQSIGVPNKGADIFTTSFYPTKNFGALGDGGAMLTDNEGLAKRFRQYCRQGAKRRDHFDVLGTNGRLDEIQAAFLNHKLPYLKQWTQKRQQLADYYLTECSAFAEPNQVVLPKPEADPSQIVWSLFTLRVPENRRSVLWEGMKERGVGCGIYYSEALTDQPIFKPYVTKDFPHARKLANEALALPIYPELSVPELKLVVDSLRSCLRKTST